MRTFYKNLGAALFLAAGIVGCGESSNSSPHSGALTVELTDAPGAYEAVYVTIDHVDVHRSGDTGDANGSWITVADVNGTYDLLKLQDGNLTELGAAMIPAADYQQMRLVLAVESNDTALYPYGNYVVVNGIPSELTVPSMEIKENHNFVMAPDGNMTMTIDFDANNSIHSTGNGSYMLQPVLHVDTK